MCIEDKSISGNIQKRPCLYVIISCSTSESREEDRLSNRHPLSVNLVAALPNKPPFIWNQAMINMFYFPECLMERSKYGLVHLKEALERWEGERL